MFVVLNTWSLLGVRQISECAYANCTELKVGCKLPDRSEIFTATENLRFILRFILAVDDHEGDDA